MDVVRIERQPSAVEKYVLWGSREWAATIFLDDRIGEICIMSQWGTYSYVWNECGRGEGKTLKDFLLGAGKAYVMNKFGYGGNNDHFFPDKTLEAILGELTDSTLDAGIRAECARELEDCEDEYQTSTEMYNALCEFAPTTLTALYEDDPYDIPWRTGTHPRLVAFMETVWPVFVEQLKGERDGT